tara:strand:- start:42703 stop:42882 length:180 start_codon:yes stop_codon:yes gene_type:complete
MIKFEDKTNNEILTRIKQLELDYVVQKQRIVAEWDKLIEMEEEAAEAAQIINKRLKNNG